MIKPKLELLALCNYASFSKNGAMSIIDIFDEIYADKLPASFPRCFLAMIVSAEANSEVMLNIQITPMGQLAQTLEREVMVLTSANARGNFILEMVNMNLPKVGAYKIKVLYEDRELGSTEFKVIYSQTTSVKAEGKYIN